MNEGADRPLRLEAAPAVADTLQTLARLARWAPRLAWPAFVIALVMALLDTYVIPYAWAGSLLYVFVFPFDIMLAVAWHRLILLGPNAVQSPPVAWRRRHLHYLVHAVIFIAILAALVLLFVLIMGTAALPTFVLLSVTGLGIWLIVTLLTPLALKLPARASDWELAPIQWRKQPVVVANIAVVWLIFLAVAYGLGIAAEALYEPVDGGWLALGAMALALVLDYIVLLMNITVITVIFRHLAGSLRTSDAPPQDGETVDREAGS